MYNFFSYFFCGASHIATAETTNQKDIWSLIHGMRSISMDEESIQIFFNSKIKRKNSNGVWDFYEGEGPELLEGIKVKTFGLARKNNSSGQSFVYINLAGNCLRLDQLKEVYPHLVLLRSAEVHSPIASYSSANKDGNFEFGLRDYGRSPSCCLEKVGFTRKN